jgi:photosystem II stability/assembly factor-like uncharacterized protein
MSGGTPLRLFQRLSTVSVLCALALSLSAASALAVAPVRPDNGWVQLAALPEQLDSPVFALAVSPADPSVVLAGGGSGTIYRSTDAGTTWSAVGHGLGRAVLTVQFSPFTAGLVYAGTRGGGLWKSTNGGATWTKQAGIPGGTVRSLGFARSMTLAGADGGLFASRDGATWAPYLSFAPLSLSSIAVAAVNDPPKILAGADASKGDETLPLYISQDGGTSWSNVKSLGSSTMVGAAAAGSPNGSNRPIVVGTNAGAFLSNDGGSTWAQVGGLPATDFTSAAYVANHADRFYVGSDGGGTQSGGVWSTADSGQSFRSLASPIGSVTALSLSAEESPTVYTATFRPIDHLVTLWAFHDTGGTPMAPVGGVVPAAGLSIAPAAAPAKAAGGFTIVRLATSAEAPYIVVGVLAVFVLLAALVLQVRRGRE